MHRQILVPETVLRDLLAQAASAARIVGHLDGAIADGPLGDHVDAIVHKLTELLGDPHTLAAPLLGDPHTLAAPMPSARPACQST